MDDKISTIDESTQTEIILNDLSRHLTVNYGHKKGVGVNLDVANAWFVENDAKHEAIGDMAPTGERVQHLPRSGIAWVESSDSRSLLVEYELEVTDAVCFSVRASNQGKEALTLSWQQGIQGMPLHGKLFCPSGQDFHDLEGRVVTVAYRDKGEALSIPLITLFDQKTDVGFTIAAHIEVPLPPFKVEVSRQSGMVLLNRRILHLKPGQSRTVKHYIMRHRGCWRPGLGWVRNKFPRFFMLPDVGLTNTHGCFVYGNIAEMNLCQQLSSEGVRNYEIHFTYPHLGKYAPDEEQWIPAIDDKWNAAKHTTDPRAPREDASYEEIRAYMRRVVKASGSLSQVRQFIRDLKALGINTYMYFQPTEAWEFFANTHFPGAIRRHEDGTPVLTWYDHVVVNCSPETEWGKYLCSQLENLLEAYPEVDGIFMDQAAEDRDDYSVCLMTDKLAEIAAQRGKSCYWNGPYMVELIEHAVGMLAEGGSIQAEQIKFLTMGNKVCCGMGTTERQYQRNLVNGLWPSAPSLLSLDRYRYSDEPAAVLPISQDLKSLHRRYMFLFELYPGKMWFLEPHALMTPPGVEGNIFERPDGEYLVPLIAPSRSFLAGPFERDVKVTVRVSGAESVRSVYLRNPEIEGAQFSVPWARDGKTITITVPWLGSACLVWLAFVEKVANPMPSEPPSGRTSTAPVSPVMIAYFALEGFVPSGSLMAVEGGLATTAPLPSIPLRRVWLNGHKVGPLNSRNYRSWHPLITISLPNDVVDYLKEDNELVIEPDGPKDFFKVRRLQMIMMLADRRIVRSDLVYQTYSSFDHPLAEGVTGSPMRIKFRIPSLSPI